MTNRLIIDTDTGVDDSAALLFALASPELSIETITTVYGNGEVEVCTRNALTVLDIAGKGEIPVYSGVNVPLMREIKYAYYVHGANAFGGIEYPLPKHSKQTQHAAFAMIEKIMANPGEMTLVALGPLTNVALALSIEPQIAKNIKELVLMGGAVLTYGNASPVASANLWHDPEAAAIVYRSGAPIVQVGLDVCRKLAFTRDEFNRICEAGLPTTDMLAKISGFISAFYQSRKSFTEEGYYVAYNDFPAIGYLIAPELFTPQNYFVTISTFDELTKGQTVADIGDQTHQTPNAKVLMDVDAQALKSLFLERILQYAA